MTLGFSVGLAALSKLKCNRESNMAKTFFVETVTGDAATCFADGVQFPTDCTFGK